MDYYRTLLKKYIEHVGNNEGVTFLRDGDRTEDICVEDWDELQKLDKEVWEEDYERI